VRSRSATNLLLGAGLENVYTMEGGIRAWQGMVAHGPPEAGMAHFTPAEDAEEIVGLAWALEEGSKLFYLGVAENFSNDEETQEMFRWLVSAEKNHEKNLLETYESLTGVKPDFEKLRTKFTDKLGGSVMEGGVVVKEALAWVRDKGVQDSLELAMAMEVNAFDLYIKMGRLIEDQNARRIFKKLSEEEQAHLEKLANLLDKRI
jgi:sulfur-carrier protein adenylyltransferase/sulfurtransferase